MNGYKGTGVDFVRKLLKARGADAAALEQKLSPSDTETFHSATTMSWVPAETAVRIFAAAAELLYPGDPRGVFELNRLMAKDNMSGIYRILLRVVSVPVLMARAAKLWSTYHSRGRGRAEGDPEDRAGTFIVEDYPECPLGLLPFIAGFLQGVLEMAGAKNINVAIDSSNPHQWRWRVTWE
jgi:hypothetical protein